MEKQDRTNIMQRTATHDRGNLKLGISSLPSLMEKRKICSDSPVLHKRRRNMLAKGIEIRRSSRNDA